jgi:hypothetical protein
VKTLDRLHAEAGYLLDTAAAESSGLGAEDTGGCRRRSEKGRCRVICGENTFLQISPSFGLLFFSAIQILT